MDTTTPRLRQLVLQPTPFCNIDCRYCYLADRKSTARMSLATIDLICRRVFESPWLGRRLDVAWHAGEPLTVPLDWYRDAFALIARRCPPGLEITHHFQTNGLLVDEAWVRFFAKTRARIGLSIDGPADLHDANRRTRRGQGTYAKAMRAVRLLQDQGLPFHVITVLTQPALDQPDRLFRFYVENGISEVGFNVEEIEGANATSSLAGRDIESKFRLFMRRFFALVWDTPGLLRVREFESTIGQLLAEAAVEDEQNTPFAILSVGWDGAVTTFSPELLGAHHPRFGSFALGQIATDDLAALARTPRFEAIADEIRRGVAACERSCRYFQLCGGGAPANKLFETGRFDSTETMHCRLNRQAVIDEVIAGIEIRTGALRQRNDIAARHPGIAAEVSHLKHSAASMAPAPFDLN